MSEQLTSINLKSELGGPLVHAYILQAKGRKFCAREQARCTQTIGFVFNAADRILIKLSPPVQLLFVYSAFAHTSTSRVPLKH